MNLLTSSRVLVTLAAGFAAVHSVAQLPQSTTSISSDSTTLNLPRSLKLTSVVNQTPLPTGIPSGNVNFYYDATNLIGSAPLTFVRGSGAMPETASATGVYGSSPVSLFSLKFPGLKNTMLGAVDYGTQQTNDVVFPRLTIFTGTGTGLFNSSTPYAMNVSTGFGDIDAAGMGDFNNDGLPDVVVHTYNLQTEQNEYYELLGKADGTFDPGTLSVVSPDTSNLDGSELMAVDDFNGDGYADVAFVGKGNGSSGFGVWLNAGNSQQAPVGTLDNFVAGPAIPSFNGLAFCTTGIATGKFTSSGNTDVILIGGYQNANQASNDNYPLCPYFTGPSYVYLFAGKGDGSLAAAAGPYTLNGAYPSAVAVADFNGDGKLDLAIATVGDDKVTIALGDGAGNFSVAAAGHLIGGFGVPQNISVADFNGDGSPDIAVLAANSGRVYVPLNDGKGNFPDEASGIDTDLTASSLFSLVAGDFNGDGLNDLVALQTPPPVIIFDTVTPPTIAAIFGSGAAQATLQTGPQTIPAGLHNLTAVFPGDNNFATSTSTDLAVTVNRGVPVVTWNQPAAIEYGTPLGATQLNASANLPGTFRYTPPAGTILNPGTATLSSLFVPTDTFDYNSVTTTQSIVVTPPALTAIAPTSANLGSGDTTLTVTGQGFLDGAVVQWAGTALTTNFVDNNHLTAVIPKSFLTKTGTFSITVLDPSRTLVSGALNFKVVAPAAVVTATGPGTVAVEDDSSVSLTVQSYPANLNATFTLTFTPTAPNEVGDPAVMFANPKTKDGRTAMEPIAANSSTPTVVDFQTGSTAGKITITIKLTLADSGEDVTPASLTPLSITIPVGPPVINSASLSRSGKSMQVVVVGYSPTRDMTQATFHFVPTTGNTLKTTDVTVTLSDAFTTWYQNTDSDSHGTQFTYTQPFTLDSDASVISSVTVTLTNSQGASQPGTAQ